LGDRINTITHASFNVNVGRRLVLQERVDEDQHMYKASPDVSGYMLVEEAH
jgi:hypothetical protein